MGFSRNSAKSKDLRKSNASMRSMVLNPWFLLDHVGSYVYILHGRLVFLSILVSRRLRRSSLILGRYSSWVILGTFGSCEPASGDRVFVFPDLVIGASEETNMVLGLSYIPVTVGKQLQIHRSF